MEYALIIKSVKRESVIADDSEQLNVLFHIVEKSEEKKIVAERSLGFPVTTTTSEIVAELKKFLAEYVAEMNRAAANSEADEIDRQVTETINDLQGGIIK